MEIIKSLEPVLEQSIHVHINLDKVRDFAANFGGKYDFWIILPIIKAMIKKLPKATIQLKFATVSFGGMSTP